MHINLSIQEAKYSHIHASSNLGDIDLFWLTTLALQMMFSKPRSLASSNPPLQTAVAKAPQLLGVHEPRSRWSIFKACMFLALALLQTLERTIAIHVLAHGELKLRDAVSNNTKDSDLIAMHSDSTDKTQFFVEEEDVWVCLCWFEGDTMVNIAIVAAQHY